MGGIVASGSSKKACKTYLRMVQNVQQMGFVLKMVRINNPIIEFLEEDARHLHHLHDDALVISIRVGDYNTHRVLVDNTPSPGTVTLPVTVGDYPQQITKNVTFLVVGYLSTYNVILGQPTLNSWKAVTSTYHLMIKFSTKYEVGDVRRDQLAARKCYITMLEMDDHVQTMNINEQWMVAEPIERLEKILLDNSRPNQTTRIDTLANPMVRQAFTTFLKENKDVFAWSYKDMLGIDPSVMVHRLNVSLSFPLICQKKQVFNQE